jgi:cytochrome c
VNEEIFVADNQGDWLPSSKIVHIQKGKFYGSRSVDFEGTEGVEEKLPVVWLPQDEIGNSPSEPTYLNLGPYKNQLIHGEVTHGGIKRVYYEEVEGQLQGALFRFVQGVEAGVNRIRWAPDGSLVVGGIGVSGNWLHYGKLHHGLQRLEYNGKTTFEMLKINAKPDGFDIEFTEPLAGGVDVSKGLLEVQMWYYLPTIEYGGPKMDLKPMPLQGLTLSNDRKTLSVKIPGLKENHVVYFHLNPETKSASGQQLWSTEAWYTLNRIPKP